MSQIKIIVPVPELTFHQEKGTKYICDPELYAQVRDHFFKDFSLFLRSKKINDPFRFNINKAEDRLKQYDKYLEQFKRKKPKRKVRIGDKIFEYTPVNFGWLAVEVRMYDSREAYLKQKGEENFLFKVYYKLTSAFKASK